MGFHAGFLTVLFLSAHALGFTVFLPDDREMVRTQSYPLRTIGALNNGCTGTLVSRDLVLTAAHCVVEDGARTPKSSLQYFYPNQINSEANTRSAITYVWWGTNTPSDDRENDWAIIRLQDALGDQYGWMGVHEGVVNSVHLVGYSGDLNRGRTASGHYNCRIWDVTGPYWLHDCDLTPGSSGGPLFIMQDQTPLIVAIQSAERRNGADTSQRVSGGYDSTYANLAIPAAKFLSTLKRLKGE